jgi:hypothetical protein
MPRIHPLRRRTMTGNPRKFQQSLITVEHRPFPESPAVDGDGYLRQTNYVNLIVSTTTIASLTERCELVPFWHRAHPRRLCRAEPPDGGDFLQVDWISSLAWPLLARMPGLTSRTGARLWSRFMIYFARISAMKPSGIALGRCSQHGERPASPTSHRLSPRFWALRS